MIAQGPAAHDDGLRRLVVMPAGQAISACEVTTRGGAIKRAEQLGCALQGGFRAKSNPEPDEVVAEYRRGRSG